MGRTSVPCGAPKPTTGAQKVRSGELRASTCTRQVVWRPNSPLPGPDRLASVRAVTEIEREVLAVRTDVLDEVHHSEDPAGRRADDELVGAGENDRHVGVGVGGAPAEPVGAADRVDIARGVLQPALSHRSGTRDVEDAPGVGALVIHDTG